MNVIYVEWLAIGHNLRHVIIFCYRVDSIPKLTQIWWIFKTASGVVLFGPSVSHGQNMTHPCFVTNGSSLEDCHTNFFALVCLQYLLSFNITIIQIPYIQSFWFWKIFFLFLFFWFYFYYWLYVWINDLIIVLIEI
jgi:hypothetical protein